jgi:hypothetical protein
MKVSVDELNYLVLDPVNRGRVVELKLQGSTVIEGKEEGTGNGCYLMYPWVNRVEKVPYPGVYPQYTDGNGIPLHGLYVDDPRKADIFKSEG